MRNFLHLLVCVILFSCAERPKSDSGLSSLQVVPNDSTALYFPLIDANKNNSGRQILDSSTNTWISGMLFALREPVLTNLSSRVEVYRLTIIGSRRHPFCIRFFKADKGGKLVSKYTDGYGGYNSGNLIFDSTQLLTAAQWHAISKKLEDLNFWSLDSFSSQIGKDGSEWILEGHRNGVYKAVARWSPEWPSDRGICDLSEAIVELSGLKDRFRYCE